MLDATDRRLLGLLQAAFPLTGEPFAALGLKLGTTEEDALRRTLLLKERGLLRCISGLFDSRSLGYQSSLVAMRIAEDRLDEAAKLISEHSAVSHNYSRDHYLNLWFTLTMPAVRDMQEEVDRLGGEVGAEETLVLPSIRVFKIGAYFDVEGVDEPPVVLNQCSKKRSLSTLDRAILRELEQDLTITKRPFDQMAARLVMDIEEFLSRSKSLQERGVMHRYGALVDHREMGFLANAMVCWIVPSASVEEVSRRMSSFKAVSHCYERKTSANWPYNIFTVIHSYAPEACKAIAEQISGETGINDYILLFSIKEYKKARVKYF